MPQTFKVRDFSAWWLLAFLLPPWLSPYTAGPTPNVWPWLLSALCVVCLWLFRRRLNPELVATGWVLAAVISALIGLVQYFGLAPALSPWINQPQAGEAYANLRQRNQFATLTSIGLVALIGWLALREASAGRLKTQGGLMPWWAYLIALLLALGNAASSSRTGLLQWGLIALFTAWWALPARRHLLVFVMQALLAYGIAVLMLPWLLQWATGVQSGGLFGRLVGDIPACSSRKILWSNVLTLIVQKPWLGWGWGELDYAHFITLYDGPRFCEILDNAHNLPLHLAVELGVPAAVAICGALGWLTWRARPWQEKDALRQMAWAVLAVIGLHSLLEYPLWYGPFQIAAGLAVWLLCAPREATPGLSRGFPSKFKQNILLAQYALGLIAIIMIVPLAGVAVSYYRVSQIYLPPDQRSAAYRDGTLAKVQDSWVFREQARFAYLSITPLTPGNAAALHAMAIELLHYSPEPRVVEKLVESAVMLGRNDEALYYLARYRGSFPMEHARWVRKNAAPLEPGTQGRPQAFLTREQALVPVHAGERRAV
ncbi:Wzy polymerase domain-containing protein [Polaromonas sp. CG_9.11]|uniref:PglL family O-oligosaccharyltransferase n=1 Tax=Polaromonas sp. CG_9.11 TaxID=2787730 RepID=UPI0018CBD9A8|nr:O-antigen ligase [Polaromonas sp. CG_9.11]